MHKIIKFRMSILLPSGAPGIRMRLGLNMNLTWTQPICCLVNKWINWSYLASSPSKTPADNLNQIFRNYQNIKDAQSIDVSKQINWEDPIWSLISPSKPGCFVSIQQLPEIWHFVVVVWQVNIIRHGTLCQLAKIVRQQVILIPKDHSDSRGSP